tara:strand:+ start:627 stop:779 length:153 start_codon:yes stop_codon:yes gene_type:complete
MFFLWVEDVYLIVQIILTAIVFFYIYGNQCIHQRLTDHMALSNNDPSDID